LDRREAKAIAEGNPYSFLHVSRPEIDLPDDVDAYDRKVYEKAGENLKAFMANGVLMRDEEPAFYLYRQTMDGNAQTGLVSRVSIDDYANGVIKKHEYTRVEKEEDRIRHFEACGACTEPVLLAYRENKKIKTITESWILGHSPEYDFVAADGVRHELWKLDDSGLMRGIRDIFEDIPALYIADGHHRSASAYKIGRRRSARNGNPRESGFDYFMAVSFPDTELRVFDYNRVISELNGMTEDEFLKKTAESFIVAEAEETPFRPRKRHEFGMYLGHRWYALQIRPERVDESDPIASLDVSLLQDRLFGPALGILDPRTDGRVDFVGGGRGLSELERRVNAGMAAAFALYPVSVRELLSVADAGLIMPPKSTWFEPKLGSGLFVYEMT
jgi:uncharacterized protein (DUF1015 family)